MELRKRKKERRKERKRKRRWIDVWRDFWMMYSPNGESEGREGSASANK
jgi:hypothetical protein